MVTVTIPVLALRFPGDSAERGERNPSLEVIFDIAKALGVKSDELLKEIK